MTRSGNRILFAVLLTLAWFGAVGVTPAAAEKPGERAKRREVEQKCADYKKKYEAAEKAAARAPRGQREEALKKRDAALKDYCECLTYWFDEAKMDLPEKYEQLCNPKPIADPGDAIPEEFRSAPPAPDTQALPGEGGAPGETPTDPCEKLAYDIKTLEEIREHLRKNNEKFPEPFRKKLERLKKEYAQCQKPGAGTTPDRIVGTPGEDVISVREPKDQIDARDPEDRVAGDPEDRVGGGRRAGPPRTRQGETPDGPRSLAPGDCVEQRAAYGRLLTDYKRATGAERQSLRPQLEDAHRQLCECLRITAPADYERFCQWTSGEPPDMPTEWGSVPAAPPPPPGEVPNPPQPAGPVAIFFGDRTRQEFRGGAVFVTHSANHAAHCNVCLQVRDGVTVTFERSPTPGGIQVTVTDPPLPPIACQERPGGGGFDCANVTASFCQMAPQATIAHLKLAPGEVQDMGVRLDYPGGEAFQFCTHGRTTP